MHVVVLAVLRGGRGGHVAAVVRVRLLRVPGRMLPPSPREYVGPAPERAEPTRFCERGSVVGAKGDLRG